MAQHGILPAISGKPLKGAGVYGVLFSTTSVKIRLLSLRH
jgi:hypothetical protein